MSTLSASLLLSLVKSGPAAFRCLPVRYGAAPSETSGDVALSLDLLLPDPPPNDPVPAVVYIHGGGWRNGTKAAGMYPWLSPLLAAHGFVAVNLGYRLTGRAAFPAQIHDAKAAIRWLRANAASYGIDPERIGVWGDSAGGHLAALLGVGAHVPEFEGNCGSPGLSSAVQAVVARCAPTDFVRLAQMAEKLSPDLREALQSLFGGPLDGNLDLARLASPFTHVHSDVPPFLVVHGTDDETVPFEQAELFVQALREHGANVSYRPIQGGHHDLRTDIDMPAPADFWSKLGAEALTFFSQRLDHGIPGS